MSSCLSVYYRLSSLLFLVALLAAIYFTKVTEEKLNAMHSEEIQLSEEALFPRIFQLVQYFATGALVIQILISFWIFSLSVEENRDLISLSIIMMMCQRSMLLPIVIYLAYHTISEEVVLRGKYSS